MADVLLQIKGLHAGVEGKEILKGLDLTVRKGEVHVILGAERFGQVDADECHHGAPEV